MCTQRNKSKLHRQITFSFCKLGWQDWRCNNTALPAICDSNILGLILNQIKKTQTHHIALTCCAHEYSTNLEPLRPLHWFSPTDLLRRTSFGIPYTEMEYLTNECSSILLRGRGKMRGCCEISFYSRFWQEPCSTEAVSSLSPWSQPLVSVYTQFFWLTLQYNLPEPGDAEPEYKTT